MPHWSMDVSLIDKFRITSSLWFLFLVGYNLQMGLDILNIIPFFIYHTITPLTLLSLDKFILLTTPMVNCAVGFLSSSTSATSPS